MDDEAIHELFDGLGRVHIRRMFGGKGIYHNSLIMAVHLRGELMLKGDEEVAPTYEEGGARRWFYAGKRGTPVNMPYWILPGEVLDDPDTFTAWAKFAYEAAVRAEEAKLGAGAPIKARALRSS
jgi:DNA transformation protein and related proteins